jgi:16S rRNA G966 N2-methylase RsmD
MPFVLQEYLDAEDRSKRFIADALGDGLHYLPGLIVNEPSLAVLVEDYGDDPVYGHCEVEILPQEMAEALTLEWIANEIARTRGIVPTFGLPNASEADYQALKASIARYGVQQPILVDENGRIIDGRLRKRACDELGIECPSIVVGKLSYAQKQQLAFELDSCRKHFKTSDKKRVARVLLRSSPSNSDRMIASATGIDHKTVGKLRAELRQRGEIPHHGHVVGTDGKKYKFPTIRAKSKKEVVKAVELLERLGLDAPNREIELRQSQRMLRCHAKTKAGQSYVAPTVADSDMQIFHQDFRTLELADESVDFIFTDPPYPEQFLPLYGDLAAFAARVLKPGGLIIAYAGQHHLYSVMNLLGSHLKYHWQCILRHTNCMARNHDRRVFSGYRPMLIFSKDGGKPLHHIRDVFDGNREKDLHPWQQGVGEAMYYIERMTKAGDLIVDCFGGSFTTAEAVLRIGDRKFVGCDIDPGCVAIGLKRIAKVRAELNAAPVTLLTGTHPHESSEEELAQIAAQ